STLQHPRATAHVTDQRHDAPLLVHPLVLPPPPRPTLFPYTTLFRSQERDQDAQHDVELLDRDQAASELRRRDLRDVHWGHGRRPADREPAQEPEGEERGPAPCQGAP